MGNALFADLTEQFLSVTVKTWGMRSGATAAEAVDVLLATGIQQGFQEDRGRPLLGNTLNEWEYPLLNGPLIRLYTYSRKGGITQPNSSLFCRKGWMLMRRPAGPAQHRKTQPDKMRGKSCDDVF